MSWRSTRRATSWYRRVSSSPMSAHRTRIFSVKASRRAALPSPVRVSTRPAPASIRPNAAVQLAAEQGPFRLRASRSRRPGRAPSAARISVRHSSLTSAGASSTSSAPGNRATSDDRHLAGQPVLALQAAQGRDHPADDRPGGHHRRLRLVGHRRLHRHLDAPALEALLHRSLHVAFEGREPPRQVDAGVQEAMVDRAHRHRAAHGGWRRWARCRSRSWSGSTAPAAVIPPGPRA